MKGPALSTSSPAGAPITSVQPTEIVGAKEVQALEDLALTSPPARLQVSTVSQQGEKDGQRIAKEAWKEGA